MKEKRLSDWAAAAAVALVLLLTAWGNAYAMLLVGIVGLIVGLVFFRNSLARGGALIRMWFPQEMDAILKYNGFMAEYKYGDFDETPFESASQRQVFVTRLR